MLNEQNIDMDTEEELEREFIEMCASEFEIPTETFADYWKKMRETENA